MSEVGEAIRKHHRELISTLERSVAALVEGGPGPDAQALAAFLEQDLLPHAVGEERYLYPEVESLLKAYGQATATMSVDHEFIGAYIRQIGEAAQELATADPDARPAAEGRLWRLALQLEAVLRLHLEKEERIYLPLFEQHVSSERQRAVLDAMHGAYGE